MAAKYSVMVNFLINYLIFHTLNNAVMNLFAPKNIYGHVSLLYFAKLLSQKLDDVFRMLHETAGNGCE